MMKKTLVLALSAMMMVSLAACGGSSSGSSQSQASQPSGGAAAASGDAVTLKIQDAWAENASNNVNLQLFIDKVAEKTNGTVKIEWGGGPEAIPTNQLGEATKNGIVDIAWSCHTYMASHIPVMEGMKLTDAAKLRGNGGFEWVDEMYQKNLNGTHYLGAVTDGLTYNLYSKEKIESLDDFKGLTFRATPAYQAFVEALGAGASNMDAGDAYQALENGVIQGYGWPSVGVKDYAWNEVSSYIIEPAFYNVDVAIFISGAAWDKLNADQQAALYEAAKELEVEAKAYYNGAIEKDHQGLVEAGMEENELPADVAEQYLHTAYEAAWNSVLAKDEENGKTLMGFTDYQA